MPRRAPSIRQNSLSAKDANDFQITPSSARRIAGARPGFEWSLRSLHKIDTGAQHFLENYYSAEDDENNNPKDVEVMEDDQSAYDIFKGAEAAKVSSGKDDSVWATLHAPLRTGVVDGRRVVFELRSNITQPPKTSRQERVAIRHEMINSRRTHLEQRLRFWLMHFSVSQLSITFLAAFVGMCVIFAGIFYALEQGCCGDPEMPYSAMFAFSFQTAATIGYGVLSPKGTTQDFLVVMLTYLSILINTLFAGLLFTKFVTPFINIQFSEVMTISNVNGVPCLSIRIGNADGTENPVTDINVRLTYSYQIPYQDHTGGQRFFRQTEELHFLSSRQHGLYEAWTLRHVLDESSPLFGLNFEEHPANNIYVFTLSVDAVQELTKATVNVQAEYGIEDILIGHSFVSMNTMDLDAGVAVTDFSKMSETEPYPVWYPARRGAYDTGDLGPQTKSWGPS